MAIDGCLLNKERDNSRQTRFDDYKLPRETVCLAADDHRLLFTEEASDIRSRNEAASRGRNVSCLGGRIEGRRVRSDGVVADRRFIARFPLGRCNFRFPGNEARSAEETAPLIEPGSCGIIVSARSLALFVPLLLSPFAARVDFRRRRRRCRPRTPASPFLFLQDARGRYYIARQ